VVEIADTVREGKKVRVSAKGGVTEEHGDMVDRRLMVDAREWLGAPDCRIYQARTKKGPIAQYTKRKDYRDAKVQLVAEAGRWPTWLRSALT